MHFDNSSDKSSEGDLLMDSGTLRVICGIMAVVFGAVIFMRRRGRSAD
jgi:hypothetical protein